MSAPRQRQFGIVLVDDDDELRGLVRSVLDESPRFQVLAEARDGAQGVALASAHRPDVMLLDLSMPVMSGLEALEPIRDVSPATKVVILSNFPQRRLGPLLLSRGAVGYLEKGGALVDLPERLLAVAALMEVASDVLAEGGVALEGELVGPRQARRFIEELLREWNVGEALDSVRLLVSEVVANAVVHTSSDVKVAVQLRSDAVRVAVTDSDPAQPERREATAADESGRGLELVETLSSSWGVDPIPGGKHVWFEVPRFDAAGHG